MIRRASAALVLVLTACRGQILLGDAPDAGTDASADAGPTCSDAGAAGTLVTSLDPSLGNLRGMAVGGGALWVLSVRGTTGAAVVSRTTTTGGTLQELSELGSDPAAIVTSADGHYAYVALHGSAQIARVDESGTSIVTNAGGAPSSIVADASGRVYWTMPASDRVGTWDFTLPAATAFTAPNAASIIRAGDTLYVTGGRSLRAYTPGVDAAPRLLATACDDGLPTFAGSFLFCTQTGDIARIDLDHGTSLVIATDQAGASDIVAGGGRVFWRTQVDATSFLVAAPVDGISGSTVVESGAGGSVLVATDGCSVFYSENRDIFRRGF